MFLKEVGLEGHFYPIRIIFMLLKEVDYFYNMGVTSTLLIK